MAVQDCDKISNIIAVAIASGDDDIAREIASLSIIKNDALQRSRALGKEEVDAVTGLNANELELRASSSDIKIRAIVQASILKGNKGNEAFMELAKQIKKTKGNLAQGTELIEKIRNAPITEYEEIARLWDDSMDVSAAIKDLNDGLAEFVSSNYSIRAYSDFYEGAVASAKKKFKDKKISLNKYEEEIAKAHDNAMKKIAKGENPTGFVPLDKEWQAIKKVFGDNPEKAGKVRSQYIAAREFLADGGLDNDLLKAFKSGGEELLGDLTPEWIAKCKDLDKLLARAFTNTEQLYMDGALRDAYRNKLAELASGKRITEKNINKMKTLINVSLFAEEGATLSDVLLDNRAYTSMKRMGFKVNEGDGRKIYNSLKTFAEKLGKGDDETILDDTIKIANIEMQPKDIIQLIYDITGDKNIIALVNAGNFADSSILNIATQKLLGNNDKARAGLMKLFQKGKEGNKISHTRGIFLRAITGLDVPDGAKVGFFDYRKGLYYKDELSDAKANFMDKLAEKNKMKVAEETIGDLTVTYEYSKKNVAKLAEELKKTIGGGFIIVNDGGWKNNRLLNDALNKLTGEDAITELYPRGGASSSFVMENGSVYFKTINDNIFDRVAGTVSIQSMGEAKPTRELLASTFESKTGRNGDKLRYQAMFTDGAVDNLGNQLSDQQAEYFAKSRIKDKDGKLIKVYHGTNAAFQAFDLGAARKSSDIQGLFFSSDIEEAQGYGDNVMEFYLNITNPADYKTAYEVFDKYKHLTNGGVMARQELIDMGYDGIIKGDGEYVAFHANQIKSVDNKLPTPDDGFMFQLSSHGTRRPFTKFDLKYGGDESGSMFGFGIYLTKDRDGVAMRYAEKGYTPGKTVFYGNYRLWQYVRGSKEGNVIGYIENELVKNGKSPEEAIQLAKNKFAKDKDAIEFINGLSASKFNVEDNARHIYTVEHPDNNGTNYIEWDKKIGKERATEIKGKMNDYIDNTVGRDNIPEYRLERIDNLDKGDPTGEELYSWTASALGGKEEASKFFDSIGIDGVHYFHEGSENYVIFNVDKAKIVDDYTWQLQTESYMNQLDITADAAKKVELFNTGRTIEDIANHYNIPVQILKGTDMIEGVKAYGAFGNGMIYLLETVKQGTMPHELFHAVFKMYVDEGTRDKILSDAVKLFKIKGQTRGGVKLTAKQVAEEDLADAFEHWFRTGEFNYNKWSNDVRGAKKFWEGLKRVFKNFADWVKSLNNHSDEVLQLFKDIANCEYLPDAGKATSADAAMVRYNDELNKSAVRYFGELLGISTEKVDGDYVKKVETLLSDMLGIDIKTFDSFADNSELWQRIDKQLSLERLTSGRFDKEIIDVGKERERILNLSEEELAEEINNKFGVLVKGGNIIGNENLVVIRDAWFNYNSATNIRDLLSAEGTIISLVNGTEGTTVSLDDIKNMFQNKTFKDKYKEMFFSGQDLTDADWKLFIKQINSDIFDGISIQFAENLVQAGYSLPLINAKKVVYDYLNGKLDLNSDFVQALFYKNNIPPTKDNLNTIINLMMPKDFKFDFVKYSASLEDESIAGDISRVIETKNRFLPDSYSALYAIEDSGKGITLGNKEYLVLGEMLQRYIDEVLDGMSKGTLKFGDAQKLKQELGFALDTFEQDFLLPKYGQFLTPQQRQAILGMKYDMPIGVSGQPYNRVEDMLRDAKERIMDKFRSTLGTMVENADINAAIAKGYNKEVTPKELQERIERRRNQLIANGSTIKEINGEYVVYSSKDALWETLNNLPENIQGLAGLKAMGRDEIEKLSNKQAYIILRYLEAAKALATTSNYATQLMYKQSPQLAQYSFFSTYVIDNVTGLPKIMGGNSLNADKFFDNIASSTEADEAIKKDIFAEIIAKFKRDGYVLAHSKLDSEGNILEKGLDDMIKDAVSRQIDEMETIKFTPENIQTAKEKMQNIYTNMFIPYTYLRDIPDGGTTMMGTKLVNVKEVVESTMKEAYDSAVEDLKIAGATDGDRIQQMITVRLNDGQVLSLDDLAKQNIDSWKKQIFDDESIFIKGADDDGDYTIDKNETLAKQQEIRKSEKEYREEIQNRYLGSLQTILNQGQSISDAERELMTSFMSDVRTDLRKYDLTNKLVDALDALSGMNEEVARGIKNYLIGFGGTVTFGKYKPGEIIERYKLVRAAYEGYYGMSLEQLGKTLPKNQAEEVAWNAARYFKNLERLLGSVDGVTGVTTSKDINKSFYHIGEVFMNLSTEANNKGVRGIFGMLSAIEQNQVLKFFKFSNPGQQSYVKEFVQKTSGDLGWDGLGGYRDYVETISGITREEFNKLFGTNYDDATFKRVVQGLTGFTLSGGGVARVFNKALDILNSSNIIFRFAMSYPGQLLTIPQQGVAYFLKQIGFEKELGIESLSDIDNIRESFGILDGAYNELNIFGKLNFNPDSIDPSSFYNRYGVPDIGEALRDTGISMADDYVNMYAKIDTKYSKPDKIARLVKWFDPYKDNANNFIDGIFARNFKNVAFVKGLRENDFMKFTDARAFLDFMNDATVNNEVKTKLLDAVAASAGRNFRNILGLGFGGLDRAVGGRAYQNILYGLMQMFNFRGSWGQNIFKQTGSNIWHMLQWLGSNVGLTKATKEEVAKYIAYSPEFINFTTALLNDLEWAFKLTRYQDNGRWPDEDDDPIHYALDYLSFIKENMNMVSQRWQGIQSFGPMRPFAEQRDSMLRSQMDPTIYQDTYGLGAFFNALGKNFLRQWKPANWLTEFVGAIEEGGWANGRAYLANKWFNLSFGSLRYMVNEDMNAYGYTYEVTGQYGGIPGIVMGEAQLGSDKSFLYELDNNETWDTMKLIANDDIPWSDKKVYWGNLWKAFINGSQFMSSIKNIKKVTTGKYNKSFFTSDDLADTIQNTTAGKEFYQKGYVTPRTPKEASIFIKTMLKNAEYRPGSSKFNKSLMQFEDFGHMDGGNGTQADAPMELWLEHMKYLTDDHGEFIMKDGQRVIDSGWTDLITNIKAFYGNQDYVTKTVYNYAKGWLNNHSSDPNYQLYIKMLGQGQSYMLLQNEIDKRVAAHNIGLKKEDKWSETDFNNAEYRQMLLQLGNSVLPGDNMTFFDKLNRLDTDDATLAALQIIQEQATEEDRKVIDKFFDVKTSLKDGETVEDVSLKPQYESILKQIGNIAKAMDEGNVDRVVAMASSLTNTFKNNDPTGIVTASTINSLFNRIYQSPSLSPSMKQEMMIGIFYDNKDFIQRNPSKMRELLGDNYDEYADLMNEMLYQWDGQVISNLESIQSSGDKSSKSATGKAKAMSSALKNLSMNYGSKGGGTTKTGKRAGQGYGQWVPVTIKGADLVKDLGLEGYSPLNIKQVVFKYKPHADFSIGKDVNRNVKVTKTQAVTKKKQLSKLESDVTKALEAES